MSWAQHRRAPSRWRRRGRVSQPGFIPRHLEHQRPYWCRVLGRPGARRGHIRHRRTRSACQRSRVRGGRRSGDDRGEAARPARPGPPGQPRVPSGSVPAADAQRSGDEGIRISASFARSDRASRAIGPRKWRSWPRSVRSALPGQLVFPRSISAPGGPAAPEMEACSPVAALYEPLVVSGWAAVRRKTAGNADSSGRSLVRHRCGGGA
jgi:hypothetical protein